MAEAKFGDILKRWEIDYLTDVRDKLQKKTDVTKSRWMLMDRDHVLGALNVGDALKAFLTDPPEGWHSTSYTTLGEVDTYLMKPRPSILPSRYKQLDNFIRFYDPRFFRSKRKQKETTVLYLDENNPIIVWIENESLAVFIAPIVDVGINKEEKE